MELLNKIWRSNFLIKLRSWEYWPFGLVYAPVFIHWIWLSIRARSLLYFTASNPVIENGGMLGESKSSILSIIPDKFKPKNILFTPKSSIENILEQATSNGIAFPFICKPDIGERGWMVRKINTPKELATYLNEIDVAFIVQEYVNLPIEMGVFYYRFPNRKNGIVSSVVIKEMLTVTGDGESDLKTLILENDRAKLQWNTLKEKYFERLETVLQPGEQLELVGIGNHCKGTKFLDGNYLINDSLHKAFDQISKQIDGFYFGRYDIRVESVEALYKGNIKIMELNGAGSEPAHIYQPGYSLWKAYKSIFHHWKVLFDISVLNHKNGIAYLSLPQGWKEYKKVRNINK